MIIFPLANDPAQHGQAPVRHGRAALLALLALAGCGPVERFYDSKLTPDTPIEWWRDLQGGRIASARPPPPGVADPYPNLADVPARPVLPDAATRRALQARLTSERDRTRREGERDPIVTIPPPARPATAATPAPVVPPDPEVSVAVFDAATARPAAPANPPAPALRPAPPVMATPAGVAPPSVVSGPLPELPAAAPAIPQLSGVSMTTSAALPRPLPSVAVRFPPGSATLSDEAASALRGLAQRRAGGSVVVSAGGDAASSGSNAQASALPLALRRVRAIADGLMDAGVPRAALRYDASAVNSGAGARLFDP